MNENQGILAVDFNVIRIYKTRRVLCHRKCVHLTSVQRQAQADGRQRRIRTLQCQQSVRKLQIDGVPIYGMDPPPVRRTVVLNLFKAAKNRI